MAGSCTLGAGVTLDQLDRDPHPVLARLREREPVSWLPSLGGWLVTRHDLVAAAMRDAATYTVDDPRFSTARVIGPSMLSLDGAEHARHRAPFTAPFRPAAVRDRFSAAAAGEAARLLDDLEPAGGGELRRGFAGPLSAAIVARALGVGREEVNALLVDYDEIVASVTAISAGSAPTDEGARAFAGLSERLARVIAGHPGLHPQPGLDRLEHGSLLAAAVGGGAPAGTGPGGLTREQIVSNAAVLLFGGIETTEGMIANALLMLLERPEALARARGDAATLDAAIDESLRLEPAAAVVDRYATTDAQLGGARIQRGDLVRLSITAANRDPAVFPDPDTFDLHRPARGNLAFAAGPHVCVGVHLARLEAQVGLAALLSRLDDLQLVDRTDAEVRGLVFRKPVRLDCEWGPIVSRLPTPEMRRDRS